jgi:hypothetical protein
MTRCRRLSTALVATALTAVLPCSAVASPPQSAEQSRHAPRAVSLVGTDLHLASGEVVALTGDAGRWRVLLGTVRHGWVVASGGSFRLVRPDGRVQRIAGRDRTNLEVTEALSDDGRRIVSTAIDQADAVTIRVVNLRGRVVLDGWYPHLRGDYMDAADGKVYVGGRSGVRVLDERTDTVAHAVRRPTSLVAVEHDTIFVGSRTHPGKVGPTSLVDPGKPRWRARFEPVAVSPDGRYVVGREGTVRSMADGGVVRRVPVPEAGDEYRFLGWGSSRKVLLETTAGRQHVLVSCVVPHGACHTAGSTPGFVSLPTSHAGPYRQP